MPLTLKIDCPYCRTTHVAATLFNLAAAKRDNAGNPAENGLLTGTARCGRCANFVAIFVQANGVAGQMYQQIDYAKIGGSLDEEEVMYFRHKLLETFPKMPSPEVPEHLPDNVRAAFEEAERTRISGAYTSAAINYGRTVDRAITPLLGDNAKGTLGQKLRKLREQEAIPQSIQDLIDAVLDDRNFAAHEEHGDFSAESEILVMRDLATILLTYLFTLPEKVRAAKAAAAERAGR